MSSELPLLSLPITSPLDDIPVDMLNDELMSLVLTMDKDPRRICDVVRRWLMTRKPRGDLLKLVLIAMGAPKSLRPKEPTSQTVAELCKEMHSPELLNSRLMKAAETNDVDMVEWTLLFGATNYAAAVEAAVNSDKKKIVSWFSEHPEYKVSWRDVASLAATKGNVDIMRICRDNKAGDWHTALENAIRFAQTEAIQFAFDSGGLPKNRMQDAFDTAGEVGKVESLKFLSKLLPSFKPNWISVLDEASTFDLDGENTEAIEYIHDKIRDGIYG